MRRTTTMLILFLGLTVPILLQAADDIEINGDLSLTGNLKLTGPRDLIVFPDGTMQGTATLIGPTGPQGQPGAQGPAGPQGEPGQKGATWKGAWDTAASYNTDDIVSFNGSAYIALRGNFGLPPAVNSADWDLLAAQGEAGIQGEQGPAGPNSISASTASTLPAGTVFASSGTGIRAATKGDLGLGNVPNVDATNAANITTGTLPAAQLPSSVRTTGNFVAGTDFLTPIGNGASLTGITARQIGALVINIKQAPYNAYGDNSHDDTTAIQSAINACGSSGGYVYLPRGKYRFTPPLTIPAQVKLFGVGVSFDDGYLNASATALSVGTTYDGPALVIGDGAALQYGNGIEDLAIYLNDKARIGIKLNAAVGGYYQNLFVLGDMNGAAPTYAQTGYFLTTTSTGPHNNTMFNTFTNVRASMVNSILKFGYTDYANVCHNSFLNTGGSFYGDGFDLAGGDNNNFSLTYLFARPGATGFGVKVTHGMAYDSTYFYHLEADRGMYIGPNASAAVFGYDKTNGQPDPVLADATAKLTWTTDHPNSNGWHFAGNIHVQPNATFSDGTITKTLSQLTAAGNGVWGGITGSLSAQTDLQTVLNAKANTASLAAVATSGSASDITSGTLSADRLPLPTATTPGGLRSTSAPSHMFAAGVGTDGTLTYVQPVAGDIAGLRRYYATTAAQVVAQLAAAGAAGGGIVEVAAGLYDFSTTLVKPARVSIEGAGQLWVTRFRWTGGNNGVILDTTNQDLRGTHIKNITFEQSGSQTGVTGILGGSTHTNYNSAIGVFEDLTFLNLAYGIRGNGVPNTQNNEVGIFDSYFKNIWVQGAIKGVALYGSGNIIVAPRITTSTTGISLEWLSPESYASAQVVGGVFIQNGNDIAIPSANGIRPTTFTGTWFEQSGNGIVNIANANTKVQSLGFKGCQFSTSSTGHLLDFSNAVGSIDIANSTITQVIAGQAKDIVRPVSGNGFLRAATIHGINYDGSTFRVDDLLSMNITGTAAGLSSTLIPASGGTGVTDFSFSGTGHKVASTSGTLTQGKQVTFDANNNLIVSAFDVGAVASGSVTWGSIAGTLASQTDLQNALNQKVAKGSLLLNVKDLGAAGDGITDDTSAIQTILNSMSGGGILFFPVGTYRITNDLTIPYNNIVIKGSGWGSKIVQVTPYKDGFFADGKSGLKIRDLHLYGPGNGKQLENNWGTGIIFKACRDSEISGNKIENWGQLVGSDVGVGGIWLRKACQNVLVHDNYITTTNNGLNEDSYEATTAPSSPKGNIFSNNVVENSRMGIITDNICLDGTYGEGALIIGNTVRDNANVQAERAGIKISYAANAVVVGNKTFNVDVGIFASNVQQGLIGQNVISGSAINGILVRDDLYATGGADTSHITLRDNQLIGITTAQPAYNWVDTLKNYVGYGGAYYYAGVFIDAPSARVSIDGLEVINPGATNGFAYGVYNHRSTEVISGGLMKIVAMRTANAHPATLAFPSPATLASGTPSTATYLRGDGTWAAVSGSGLSITEQDGSPAGSVTTLKVTNGTLTSEGGGVFSLSTSGGGSSVSDAAYGANWNEATTIAPSQNSVYDKIETLAAGAAASTDNAIARFDGTSGKLIQNSGVTISDSNSITASQADSSLRLTIRNTSSTAARYPGFEIVNYNGGFGPGGYFLANTARGSSAAPAAVVANDGLFNLNGYGYGTTGFQLGASIQFYADGTFTDTAQPARVEIYTGSATGGLTERMRIASTGNIGIGTKFPNEKLEVSGNVKATAFIGDGSGLTNLSGQWTTEQVTIDFPATVTGSCSTVNVSIASAQLGDRIVVAPASSSYQTAEFLSATAGPGSVYVNYCNFTGVTNDPASAGYKISLMH